MLDDDSDESSFIRFRRFFFLSRILILDYLYFLSSDEPDSLDGESDNDGYDSESSGTWYFPLRFDDFVGCVIGLGCGVFVPIGVKSKCDVFAFVVFVPILVDYKVGCLIWMF